MQSINILIVEDNEVNQIVAKALLRKWDMAVTIACNGKEALTLVQTKDFHLILMDLQMPEMDGYECTRNIRAFDDAYYKTIPIIAFSASSMINSKARAIAFGMTDFVNKPFVADDLKTKIEKYVTGAKNQPEERSLLSIYIDQHTNRDPAYKLELSSLLIHDLLELKHAMQRVADGHDPQLFFKTISKVTTTIEIISNEDLNQTIASLKDHYQLGTAIDLKEKLTLFVTLCDYTVKVLKDEVTKCEGLPGSHSLQV